MSGYFRKLATKSGLMKAHRNTDAPLNASSDSNSVSAQQNRFDSSCNDKTEFVVNDSDSSIMFKDNTAAFNSSNNNSIIQKGMSETSNFIEDYTKSHKPENDTSNNLAIDPVVASDAQNPVERPTSTKKVIKKNESSSKIMPQQAPLYSQSDEPKEKTVFINRLASNIPPQDVNTTDYRHTEKADTLQSLYQSEKYRPIGRSSTFTNDSAVLIDGPAPHSISTVSEPARTKSEKYIHNHIAQEINYFTSENNSKSTSLDNNVSISIGKINVEVHQDSPTKAPIVQSMKSGRNRNNTTKSRETRLSRYHLRGW